MKEAVASAVSWERVGGTGVAAGRRPFWIPVWGASLSTLSMIVGWNWDISWHRSIGRDTVWTIAHIAIYVALLIAFLYNAWLVLDATFRRDPAGVRVLGFRGPTGAFVTLWSILLQGTGILFDNWWHAVYGLDSAVFTPPHFVLGFAIYFFYFGQLMILVSLRNTAGEEHRRLLSFLVVLLASFMLGHQVIGLDPSYGHYALRSHSVLMSSALMVTLTFAIVHGYFERLWAAPTTGALYMAVAIALMQIFQFFPATPRFGPVYHTLDRFLPPVFPIPMAIPALAYALVLTRAGRPPSLRAHALAGSAFILTFTASNWLLSLFLETPLAHNRFFASDLPASAFLEDFRPTTSLGLDRLTGISIVVGLVLATISSVAGRSAGLWLRRLYR